MNRTLRRALLAAAAVGAPTAVNTIIAARSRPPREPLDGEMHVFDWTDGRVRYTAKGEGRPLLLVHGIYAGASSYEWRSNFDSLAREFRVYAPDLPGFGLSDMPDVAFSGLRYARFIEDFAHTVIRESLSVVASSLSGAFCVAAQSARPYAERLALVCPTGIQKLTRREGTWMGVANALFATPVLGTSLYNTVTSMSGIRYYLENQVYLNPRRVTPEIVAYHHAVAHLPGADRAARAFITGRLNLDVSDAFSHLAVPVMLLWGRRARITPLQDADAFLERNGRARLHVFEYSGLLPHDEEADLFNRTVRDFCMAVSPETTPAEHAG